VPYSSPRGTSVARAEIRSGFARNHRERSCEHGRHPSDRAARSRPRPAPSPRKVDGAEALAVSRQPVGERLARPVVVSPGQAGQAIRHMELVARAQEAGTQETSGQVKRGWPGPARNRETRPSGLKKTIAGSRRSIVSIPTRRQKSARLVQQAILTCWQLSTSSPVTGSLKELARPPSLGRLSNRVIRKPRSTKHDAAARPPGPRDNDNMRRRRHRPKPRFPT